MHSLLTPEKRDGHHVRRASVLMRSFVGLLNWLFPLSFAATQLFEPLLQNCLLIRVDARKHHPIPILGNRNTTLPSAENVVFACEILTRISVPSGDGFSMSRKHPPALKSLVLALSFVSDTISAISASAIMG